MTKVKCLVSSRFPKVKVGFLWFKLIDFSFMLAAFITSGFRDKVLPDSYTVPCNSSLLPLPERTFLCCFVSKVGLASFDNAFWIPDL